MPQTVNYQWLSLPNDLLVWEESPPVGKPCLAGVAPLLPFSPVPLGAAQRRWLPRISHRGVKRSSRANLPRTSPVAASLVGTRRVRNRGLWVEFLSGVENVTRGLEGDARRPLQRRYKDRRGGGSDVRDADFRRYEEEVRTNFASANWNRGDIPLNYKVSPPLEL